MYVTVENLYKATEKSDAEKNNFNNDKIPAELMKERIRRTCNHLVNNFRTSPSYSTCLSKITWQEILQRRLLDCLKYIHFHQQDGSSDSI